MALTGMVASISPLSVRNPSSRKKPKYFNPCSLVEPYFIRNYRTDRSRVFCGENHAERNGRLCRLMPMRLGNIERVAELRSQRMPETGVRNSRQKLSDSLF